MGEATETIAASPGGMDETTHRELRRAWYTSLQLGASLLATWSVALALRFAIPRHLGPTRLGELNFAEGFASGFIALLSFGVDTYSMREVAVRPAHASDYFGGVTVLRAAFFVLLQGSMLAILYAQGKPSGVLLAAFVAGSTYAIAWFSGSLATFLQAVGSTKRLAIANVIAKFCWGGGVLLAILGTTAASSLWLFLLPGLVAEVVKLTLIFPTARGALQLRMRIDTAATRRVLAASFPYFLNGLALSTGGTLTMWALDLTKTDAREVGWFTAAVNLLGLTGMFVPLLQWVFLPMLSRAQVRAAAEVPRLVSFALEAFLLAVFSVVVTVGLNASQLVGLAFGPGFEPAALTLSIAMCLIVLMYVSVIVSMGLVAQGYSWSLSSFSLVSVAVAPGLCLLLIPLFHRWIGQGGEAAGAMLACTLSELTLVVLAILRMGSNVFTRRFRNTMLRALVAMAVVISVHLTVGDLPIIADPVIYFAFAVILGAIRPKEVRVLVHDVRAARVQAADASVTSPETSTAPSA